VTLSHSIARLLPAGLRARGRDWFETRFRGTPPAMLEYQAHQLSVNLDLVLSHYRIEHSEVRYLQVGAFDGVAGDPIYPLIERHHLQGIVLEPQKDAFERLQANYARFPHFHLVNAAIADHDGFANMYRIHPEAQGPAWLHQIASFDRRALLSHAHMVPNLESMIVSEQVRCMTFATLFAELGVERVDMLQIDAEGYDAELLRLFDIPSRRPAIVNFEHKHLSVSDHDNALALLVGQGYRVAGSVTDTLAYLMNGASGAKS
jgi:FkbM family methyltransferase